MASAENPLVGQTPEDPQIELQKKHMLEAGGRGGGIEYEYHKAEPVIEAIKELEPNIEWSDKALDKMTLGMLEAMGVSNAIYGLERLDFYGSTAVTGLVGEMGNCIDKWEDGGAEEKRKVLEKNRLALEQTGEVLLLRSTQKERHSLDRPKVQGRWESIEVEDEEGKKKREWVYVCHASEEERIDWAGEMVQLTTTVNELKSQDRTLKMDPEVQKANDFFTLIGCTEGEAEKLADNEEMVDNRRTIHYWAEAEARGWNSLVEYYGQMVKALSDVDTSMDLLTKSWNDKPANTELFALLKSPAMNVAVTETFRILLDMDVVDGKYVTVSGTSTEGKSVSYEKFEQSREDKEKKSYLLKYGLVEKEKNEKGEEELIGRSAFNKDQTPEGRKEWLDRMRKCVRDRLKKKGVEKPGSWAKHSLPVALAFYEILLLGARAEVRHDVKGKPIRNVVTLGEGDKKRIFVDSSRRPVYRAEKGGSGTVTGWLSDINEKLKRTRERYLWQGAAGYSAPTPLSVFGAPEEVLVSYFEKDKYKDSEMSMLEAVRTGRATVGECFGVMGQTKRGLEALNLFRAVQLFNAIAVVPLARLDIVINENAADDKFLADTLKYMSTLKKAGEAIFGKDDEGKWKTNLMMVNAINIMYRYAKRRDIAEGGNTQATQQEGGFSFGTWFDETFEALRRKLCYDMAEMDHKVFDLGVKLAKKTYKGAETVKEPGDFFDRGVLLNDRIGMLRFSDVKDENGNVVNQRLLERLKLDPRENERSTYLEVALGGPDGEAILDSEKRVSYIDKLL